MSREHTPELGPYAAEFIELFEAEQFFRMRAAIAEQDHGADSESYTTAAASANKAMLDLEFYVEEPETAEQLFAVLDYSPVSDPVTEERRNELLALLSDTSRHRGPISPASIQKKIDALAPAPAGFSIEVTDVARFALSFLTDVVTPRATVPQVKEVLPTPPESTEPEPVQEVAETEANAEIIRPALDIKVRTEDMTLEMPDGSVIPLMRRMQITRNNLADERIIAKDRLKALEIASQLTGRVRTTEVFRQMHPGVDYETQGRGIMRQLVEFLKTTHYDGEPLVEVYKPTEAAKRMYIGPGKHQLSFEYVEGMHANAGTESDFFALSNGEILSPRETRLMRLLLRHTSADNILTSDIFDKSGVITEEVLERIKDPVNIFSSAMSTLRRKLMENEGNQYIIHAVRNKNDINPDTSRPRMAYWLEVAGQSEVDRLGDRGILIADSALLLLAQRNLFEKMNITFDDETIQAFERLVARYTPKSVEPATNAELAKTFAVLSDDKTADSILTELSDDADAVALLEYMFENFVDQPERIQEVVRSLGSSTVEQLAHSIEYKEISSSMQQCLETAIDAEIWLVNEEFPLNSVDQEISPEQAEKLFDFMHHGTGNIKIKRVIYRMAYNDRAVTTFRNVHKEIDQQTFNRALGELVNTMLTKFLADNGEANVS